MLLKDHPLGAVVEALPGLFDPRTWLPTILAAHGMLRRQDVGALVRSAADAIGAGARQEAVSWIALGLRCHADRILDEIRRQGIFRCSKYRFRSRQLRPVVSTLLTNARALSLADDVTHYLQSVSSLLQLGSSARNLDASLREFLVRRNERALKTVVAVVDSLFMLTIRLITSARRKTGNTIPKRIWPKRALTSSIASTRKSDCGMTISI